MSVNPSTSKNRLLYFAGIGVTSTVVHISVVVMLVSIAMQRPLVANIIAFFTAFSISYLGHKHLTFANLKEQKQLQLPYFFIVAVSAGFLNEFLYFLFLRFTPLNYLLSLIIVVGIVSVYTFTASRLWACR